MCHVSQDDVLRSFDVSCVARRRFEVFRCVMFDDAFSSVLKIFYVCIFFNDRLKFCAPLKKKRELFWYAFHQLSKNVPFASRFL